MKYALVDGKLREAAPGLRGTCPISDALLTPKCGKIRVPHWAHPPGVFDHRWEPETDWHRGWKNRFPIECHEVPLRATNGERHYADVKTKHGMVIEFQNSPISEHERRSREDFYRPMCWVVNGQRLKLDRQRFYESLRLGTFKKPNPLTWIVPIDKCVLLQKWAESRTLVFFDFGENEDPRDMFRFGGIPILWAMSPKSPKGSAILRPLYRDVFLEAAIKGEPLSSKGIDFSKALVDAVRRLAPPVSGAQAAPWRPLPPWRRSAIKRGRSWRRR